MQNAQLLEDIYRGQAANQINKSMKIIVNYVFHYSREIFLTPMSSIPVEEVTTTEVSRLYD